MREDLNSMTYWWPRVCNLDVPMPETIIVPVDGAELYRTLDGAEVPADILTKLEAMAGRLGYPVFLRTDHTSAKHDYRETCYVRDKAALAGNIYRLIEASALADFAGLPVGALVLRRFLRLADGFEAFNGLPIAPERRFFVRDGEVQCSHPYWPEGAIEQGYHHEPLRDDWRQRLASLNKFGPGEHLLPEYAKALGVALGGYWSVDFAFGNVGPHHSMRDERWYFIDAATGERSWHPEDCSVAAAHQQQEPTP